MFQIIWDLDEDLNGNVDHIGKNSVTKEEVEFVLKHNFDVNKSRSSDNFVVRGYTKERRWLIVVIEFYADIDTIYPVTAFEPTKGQ